LPAALRAARRDDSLLNRQYAVLLRKHKLTASRTAAIREEIKSFTLAPTISLLMPVFNIERNWLEAAVNSVVAQLYPHWQLCIADDASTSPYIGSFLAELAARDSRIKVARMTVNEGISGASNRALEMATGDFVAPMDHDDVLSPDAVYEVVKRINEDPSVDFLYTDHDVRNAEGVRRHPFFKPDWSPDLLLSMNYVTHFSVFRRTLVERAGAFRTGLEGSQDYDLVLRVTELTDRIVHIPKALYSWSQAPNSVARDPGAKPYAHEAGRRALQDAIARRGIEGEVIDGYGAPYRYRVKRSIIAHPRVSIIIPTRDDYQLLSRCVASIENGTHYRNFEIIIVDNESTDPSIRELHTSSPHRVVPYAGPFNFARMNNEAAAAARGEHLLFLNDAIEAITPDWLESMLEHSQRREVGAVGARLLFPNGTLQHAGIVLGIRGNAGHPFWGFPGDHPGYYDLARVIRNFSAVTAACLMTRKAVFEEMDGFDDRLFDVSYNDVDLCLRLRSRDYLVVYTPYAVLYHHRSPSRGKYDPEKDRKYEQRLRERWQRILEDGDPYYNPNLTLTKFDYSLRV
jgi:glycosyltransferase involved in cell wall biosynthesis